MKLATMFKAGRYPLAKLLERDANNLDLIRVLCACLVIFGHAALVVDDPRHPFGDPFSRWLNYEGVYAGSIAVRVFFFISGLLVTDSLLRKKSPAGFIVGRIMRIWPALTLLMIATVFIVGPLLSRYAAGDYFTHPGMFRHLRDNLLLIPSQRLPGVFLGEVPPKEINSSLWTLGYEVSCYAVLLILFALRVASRRWLCVGVTIFIFVEALLKHSLFFPLQDTNFQIRYLPSAFAFGALLAVFKDRITLGPEAPFMAALVFLPLKTTLAGPHLFFILLFVAVLYASALPLVRKVRIGADLSYGTYLWGFFVQQIIALHFAELGFTFNLVSSLCVSLLLAFLSWHLVEKRAIALGHRWSRSLQRT